MVDTREYLKSRVYYASRDGMAMPLYTLLNEYPREQVNEVLNEVSERPGPLFRALAAGQIYRSWSGTTGSSAPRWSSPRGTATTRCSRSWCPSSARTWSRRGSWSSTTTWSRGRAPCGAPPGQVNMRCACQEPAEDSRGFAVNALSSWGVIGLDGLFKRGRSCVRKR